MKDIFALDSSSSKFSDDQLRIDLSNENQDQNEDINSDKGILVLSNNRVSRPLYICAREDRNQTVFSIRIHNGSTCINTSLGWNEFQDLMFISQYFRDMYSNLQNNENEILVYDSCPMEASMFLLEILSTNRVRNCKRPIKQWDKIWAILSVKWSISEYIELYIELIRNHFNKVNPPKDVELIGANEMDNTNVVNGIYSPTNEYSGGMPIYALRKNYSMNNSINAYIILEFYEPKLSWHIKRVEDKGTSRTCAYIKCNFLLLIYIYVTDCDCIHKYVCIYMHLRIGFKMC